MGWQVFSVVQLFAGDTIINPSGVLVYSGAPAAGNLIFSAAPQAGTDQFGNSFLQGATVYGSSAGFPQAQLNAGNINFNATSAQFSPAVIESFGIAGEIAITSGLATNTDGAANIIIDSSQASGIAATLISFQAAQITLNTTATTNCPSPNVNPGHQSSAPAAYNQAYEQASTNRINQIMDVLVQTGVWHT